MHRSQRTGAVTWATSRAAWSAPSSTPAPSALDSRIRAGVAGVMPPATAASAFSAGAMYGVWNAPATCSAMTRALAGGVGGELLQPGQRAGGDDLAGAVAVGRVAARRPRSRRAPRPRRRRAPRSCRSAPARRRRPSPGRGRAARVIAASGVSTPASAAAPSSPTLWPATTRDVVQRQLLGGEQRGGDQQRLGPGGVLDLVGVGVGAEVDQVDPGERGPPAQPGLGAGQRRARGRGSRASGSPGPGRVRRARL